MAAIGNLPGVPALLTGFSAALGVLQNPIVSDVLSGLGISVAPKWGIYGPGGIAVVVADTVVDLSYKQDWVVADYPIEQGGFVSYDKVATPFEARVRFVAGGSIFNTQSALLDSIAAIAGDTNLYSVVTPIRVYPNANIRHYDYHRTVQNGLGVLAVDVWLSEIRIPGVATGGTSVSSFGAAGSFLGALTSGNVQASAATAAQINAASGSYNPSWPASTY